jgi:type III secretory pathway lipoprotein EscJ
MEENVEQIKSLIKDSIEGLDEQVAFVGVFISNDKTPEPLCSFADGISIKDTIVALKKVISQLELENDVNELLENVHLN